MKRMGFLGLAVAMLLSCGFASAEVEQVRPSVTSAYIDHAVYAVADMAVHSQVAVRERLRSQPVTMIAEAVPANMIGVGAGYRFLGVKSPISARISAPGSTA